MTKSSGNFCNISSATESISSSRLSPEPDDSEHKCVQMYYIYTILFI